MDERTKPKLLFFQWRNEGAAEFYLLHKQHHVKCLSEFFEVIVISTECDYQQVCDQYQPDVSLFESGIAAGFSARRIKNTFAYPEIPKLGLYNGDPFCGFHSAFLSDMDHWGIETFFSICINLAEYIPGIADNLFVWPNFIDADIYQDYGVPKIIPILISGKQSQLYPWRQKIDKIISQSHPSLICPHMGYDKNRATSRMTHGEQYARMINAAWFAPACGTMAKEIVRKHFEIPASKSCLITEKTPAVEAAGFVDMQNCIFVDDYDVLDKLDYLFQNPEILARITDAGYQLVHNRHTLKQRDQIFQWFKLHKAFNSTQRITQKNPFESLTIVEKTSKIPSFTSVGLDTVLIRQGDEKLWAGKYNEAEALYLGCLNYVDYQAQPKLRLALCNLYKGNAAIAMYWIAQPIHLTLEHFKALDPDPVEWAYFLLCLLCQGKLDDAAKKANQFPFLHHPELEYTRIVIDRLKNRKSTQSPVSIINSSELRCSAHQLPDRDFNNWINNLCIMLKACQQTNLAKALIDSNSSMMQEHTQAGCSMEEKEETFGNEAKNWTAHQNLVYYKSLKILIKIFKKIKSAFWIKANLRKIVLGFLHYLERKFGFFLPHLLSESSADELFSTIQRLAKEANVRTVLIIGAFAGERCTEAFLAGIRENKNLDSFSQREYAIRLSGISESPNKPTVFCMNGPNPQFIKLQKHYANAPSIRSYKISSGSKEGLPREIENIIKKIKQENRIDCFDLVLINSSKFTDIVELDEIYQAKFILLDGINTFQGYQHRHRLAADPNYTLVKHNPCLRNGYAIFEKNR